MANRPTRYSAVIGALLLAVSGVSACDETIPSGDSPDPAEQVEPEPESAEPEPEPEEPEQEETEQEGPEEAEPAEEEPETPPADLPDDFPDIGVPFPDHIELVATPSAGDPWVLEFVTDSELTFINNWIEEYFTDELGWQGVNREVTGQQTVTTGTKDQYTLVIAVAPEPTDDFKTSLYYTLSTN